MSKASKPSDSGITDADGESGIVGWRADRDASQWANRPYHLFKDCGWLEDAGELHDVTEEDVDRHNMVTCKHCDSRRIQELVKA